MAGQNLRLTLSGCALLAAGIGCSAPVAAVRPADTGRPIDRSVIDGFQRGVTTRAEVLLALGPPSSQKLNPQDGTATLAWTYVHSEAHETVSVLALLQFDSQDKLLLKAVSQDSRTR